MGKYEQVIVTCPDVCTTRYVSPTSAGTGSAGKRASGANMDSDLEGLP